MKYFFDFLSGSQHARTGGGGTGELQNYCSDPEPEI